MNILKEMCVSFNRLFAWGCIIFIAALTGCSVFQPVERGVMNRSIFYSSTPSLNLKVSPDMEYVGVMTDNRQVMSADGTTPLSLGIERYIFVSANEKSFRRAASVNVKTISSSFLPDIYRDEKNILEKGKQKFLGKTFEYITKVEKISADEEMAFAQGKGFIVPECYLMTAVGRMYGVAENYLVDIRYRESFDLAKFPCDKWESPEELSGIQREYLEKFNSRFKESVQSLR